MKKILILILFFLTVSSFIFADDYITWATDDRVTKNPDEEYFAHNTFPIGSRVKIDVNGAEKILIVNARPKDKRATASVNAQIAKEMGFFYMGRDNVITTLLSSFSASDFEVPLSRVNWYNIEGIAPRKGQGIVQLFSILIEKGYKVEVDRNTKTLKVKYIPEYRLENELKDLTLLSDVDFPPYSTPAELL